MNRYDELMTEAKRLEAHLDTDWAEEHVAEYDRFEHLINEAYDAGTITAEQFDELACTAFYDYDELKCEY